MNGWKWVAEINSLFKIKISHLLRESMHFLWINRSYVFHVFDPLQFFPALGQRLGLLAHDIDQKPEIAKEKSDNLINVIEANSVLEESVMASENSLVSTGSYNNNSITTEIDNQSITTQRGALENMNDFSSTTSLVTVKIMDKKALRDALELLEETQAQLIENPPPNTEHEQSLPVTDEKNLDASVKNSPTMEKTRDTKTSSPCLNLKNQSDQGSTIIEDYKNELLTPDCTRKVNNLLSDLRIIEDYDGKQSAFVFSTQSPRVSRNSLFKPKVEKSNDYERFSQATDKKFR